MVSHGMIVHPIGKKCKMCDEMKDNFYKTFDKGVYYRYGIKTLKIGETLYEKCDKHNTVWKEGAEYPWACEECVNKAQDVKIEDEKDYTFRKKNGF